MWLLKVVENDLSFRACDGVGDLFRQMFPGAVSQDFTCSSMKGDYVIRFGLGPYFKDALIKDVIGSNHGYTLHYDETTNDQVKKQLDIVIRYWSNERNRIVVRYFDSLFFGHAQADTVVQELLKTLTDNGIPLNKLLCLSSDGPNVNKSIAAKVNKELNEAGLLSLINVGMCNLHAVHNGFGKGLDSYGGDAEKLAVELYYWFKHSAQRRQDFHLVQIAFDMEKHFFIRHVPCRWLTLTPALVRILELWNAVKEYFIQLPKSDKSVEKNERYKCVMALLQNPATKVLLNFTVNIGPLFEDVLRAFQAEQPMVHLLHKRLCEFLQKLMLRFIRTDVIAKKSGPDLMSVSV